MVHSRGFGVMAIDHMYASIQVGGNVNLRLKLCLGYLLSSRHSDIRTSLLV
jgi:hypothetical protein